MTIEKINDVKFTLFSKKIFFIYKFKKILTPTPQFEFLEPWFSINIIWKFKKIEMLN